MYGTLVTSEASEIVITVRTAGKGRIEVIATQGEQQLTLATISKEYSGFSFLVNGDEVKQVVTYKSDKEVLA